MNMRTKRWVSFVVGALLLATGFAYNTPVASAETEPWADGMTIRWSGSGYWQVQDRSRNFAEVCADNDITSCTVSQVGEYQVINHTTGQKWSVVKVTSSSDSSDSSDSSASSLAPPVITTIDTTRGTATLNWSSVSGAVGYNVYRNGDYHTTVTSSPYTDRDSPSTYVYYVTAFDATKKNFSKQSNAVGADTRVATSKSTAPTTDGLPGQPSFKSLGLYSNYIQVSWHRPANATGVNVYRNNDFLGSVNFPDHIYNDFEGEVGDSYHLVAYRDGKMSVPTAKKKAVSDTQPLKSLVNSNGGVTLRWTAQRDTRYMVYHQTTGAFVQIGLAKHLGTTAPGAGSFHHADAMVASKYAIIPISPNGVKAPLVRLRVDVEEEAEKYGETQLRQAGLGGLTRLPPPPPLDPNIPDPPDPNDPSNWPGADPFAAGREESLRELFRRIDDAVVAAKESIRRFSEALDTRQGRLRPNMDILGNYADDDMLDNGFQIVPGTNDTYRGPNGATATVTTHPSRVITVETVPDPKNPGSPGLVTITERQLNPNGSYTKTQTRVHYSYGPNGQSMRTGIAIQKTGYQKRVAPGPESGNGSNGGDSDGGFTVNPTTGVTENISGSHANSLTTSELDPDRCDSCP